MTHVVILNTLTGGVCTCGEVIHAANPDELAVQLLAHRQREADAALAASRKRHPSSKRVTS